MSPQLPCYILQPQDHVVLLRR
uniref:Uncharacterized protein n=1 Tax=Anguilla anguilla TaxID=7936 RepID=A0A0E9QVB9_ANGAN